ncbi:N-formylglutamate amidohydrolase [Rhodobacteraceae bacterium MCCB 386]|nr:N-formylglutamate amidohydrolase [Roseitranquillus sediminis]
MDWQPYDTEGLERGGRWLVTCDHASNAVPVEVIPQGDLGLPDREMERHIAYDVGAAGLVRDMARRLDSPAILGTFSRLVIDPNRGEDDPTLVMRLYDGTVIPGNRDADEAEVERRLDLCHRPYHAALGALAARRGDTVVCAIHSFTPRLSGRAPRPWHVGVLYAGDNRLAWPLIRRLREDGHCVGDNEPYDGHLPGDSIDRHAIASGRLNVLLEVRHDLIATADDQAKWAARLAPALEAALAETHL